MPAAIGPTEENLFTQIVAVMQPWLAVPLIRGINNRTPMPVGDFVVATPGEQVALATNVETYPMTPTAATLAIERSVKYAVQIDCYGASANDNAGMIATLLRSSYGVSAFVGAPTDYGVRPLYTDDPKQLPLIDAEQQYEERWMVQSYFQFDPSVTVPQQFANEVDVTLINVDVEYLYPPVPSNALQTNTGSFLVTNTGSFLVATL